MHSQHEYKPVVVAHVVMSGALSMLSISLLWSFRVDCSMAMREAATANGAENLGILYSNAMTPSKHLYKLIHQHMAADARRDSFHQHGKHADKIVCPCVVLADHQKYGLAFKQLQRTHPRYRVDCMSIANAHKPAQFSPLQPVHFQLAIE